VSSSGRRNVTEDGIEVPPVAAFVKELAALVSA
jgi:hypothetical protein